MGQCLEQACKLEWQSEEYKSNASLLPIP
jgi:hypothetical protein